MEMETVTSTEIDTGMKTSTDNATGNDTENDTGTVKNADTVGVRRDRNFERSIYGDGDVTGHVNGDMEVDGRRN